MPDSFAAPLVRVKVDGETYYLNDTDQYARLGSTSYDGRLGFVLSSQAAEVIKAAKDCEDKTDTDYTLTVSDSGKTRIGVTRHYYGGNYGAEEPLLLRTAAGGKAALLSGNRFRHGPGRAARRRSGHPI